MPGFTGLKCFCDSCATAAAEPCASNADCPGGAVCGGKRCVGGTNNGAPCTGASECPAGGGCYVPGTASKPNACGDFTCSPNSADPDGPNEGVCAGGPFDMFCGPTATFQACFTHADCVEFPGDTCLIKPRECFTDNGLLGAIVNATGVANGPNPTVAALFCLGPASSATVNSAWGLPGLGRLELPGIMGALP